MISHELKCIFIHIPRTAGSSIEKQLIGKDWWNVDKKTKHLIASQAKKIYSEYWEEYFKFSFVRNPYSRMLSISKFNKFYYDNLKVFNGIITENHIQNYKKIFGSPVLLEYDYRFYRRKDVENENHKPYCVYSNILDEKLDYIGKLETLEEDFKNICDILKIKYNKLKNIGQSSTKNVLNTEAKTIINEIYEKDFFAFNYKKEYI